LAPLQWRDNLHISFSASQNIIEKQVYTHASIDNNTSFTTFNT
jgi:hypothetical protein